MAVAFFGDGAGQTGVFHESLNLAALWKLPVIFVCENNGYVEFSPLSAHTVVERLGDYAAAYSIPSVTVDGGDVIEVNSAVEQAVAAARKGAGPGFVEVLTHRLRGHYEGDPARYRKLSERAEWKERDPVARFAALLAETGVSEEPSTRSRPGLGLWSFRPPRKRCKPRRPTPGAWLRTCTPDGVDHQVY